MTRLLQILVALAAVVYAAIGIWALVDPLGLLTDVGVAVSDDRGIVELRAMYGGLQLGMAAFLLWSLTTTERTHTALVASTLTLGGLGGVRTLTWLALRPPGLLLPGLCAIELTGAVIGTAVLWMSRRV